MRSLVFCVILIHLLNNPLSVCQTDLPYLLELFYEETGKFHTIDEIETFLKYPIVLNRDNLQQISELLGTSKKTANRIVTLARGNLTIDEICDSLNLLPSQCELLKYCTTIEKNPASKHRIEKAYSLELKSRLYTRFEKDSSFLGNYWDSYQSIRFRLMNFYFGTSLSKDAGEQSYLDNKKFFAQYKDHNYSLVLGRFTCKSFLGNILGEPYGTRKGASILFSSSSNLTKLKPTLSALEYGTFNGLAFATDIPLIQSATLSINGFISDISRAGTYDTSQNKITSVYISDYFRTANELSKKNALKERCYFIQFISSFSSTKVGYSSFFLKYDKPIETLSNKFIYGTSNFYNSFYFEHTVLNSLKILGETSFDRGKNFGMVSGVSLFLKKFSSVLNFRYFSPNFRSPFGSILGENSYPNNEFGILYSCEISSRNVDINFYADFFKSIVNTKYLQVPFYGQEIFIQSIFRPFPRFSTRFRIGIKEKTDYVYNPQRTYQIPYQRSSYKILLENKFVPFANFKTSFRVDFVYLNHKSFLPNESGFHFSLHCEYNNPKVLKIGSRINYFSTESYSSAIYFFDIVAPEYMYSVPFYGTGLRMSSWIGKKLWDSMEIFFRYHYEPKSRNKNFVLGQLNLTYSL